jgi:peptide/nickel transport system ATP-binding protein
MTVGQSIARAAALGQGGSKREVERSVATALDRVGLAGELASRYPHELSGGERQRCALARAIVAEPDVLVCDEVTSSLDMSAQAVVMDLLAQLREHASLSVVFVTHNMALVTNYADLAVVLNGGRVVERGDVRHLIDSPDQGYTKRLVDSTPNLGMFTSSDTSKEQS